VSEVLIQEIQKNNTRKESREVNVEPLLHPVSRILLEEIIEEMPFQKALVPNIVNSLEDILELIELTKKHNNLTGEHLGRVGRLACLLAKKTGLSWRTRLECLFGGWIHDVGKNKIPIHILDTPRKLTYQEFETMKKHVEFGCQILESYPRLRSYLNPVKYHHERWDGKGYPYGLKKERIPLTGRISAIADAFDAMTSFRPYALYQKSIEEGCQEVARCIGGHFDPALAKCFLTLKESEIESVC